MPGLIDVHWRSMLCRHCANHHPMTADLGYLYIAAARKAERT